MDLSFLKDAGERAVNTAWQFVVGATAGGLFTADWHGIAIGAATAAGAAVAKALAVRYYTNDAVQKALELAKDPVVRDVVAKVSDVPAVKKVEDAVAPVV